MLDLIKYFPNKPELLNLILVQLRYVRCLPSAENLNSLVLNCQNNIKFVKSLQKLLGDGFDVSSKTILSDYLEDLISNNELNYLQIFDLYDDCYFEHKIPDEMVKVHADYQDYLLYKHFKQSFKFIETSEGKQFLTHGPFLFELLNDPQLSFYTLDSDGNQSSFINPILSQNYAGRLHFHLKDDVLPCKALFNRSDSPLWQLSDCLYDISNYGFPIRDENINYEIHPNANNVNALIKMKVKVHLFSDDKNVFGSVKYTDYMSEMNLFIRISFGRMCVRHLVDAAEYSYQEINLLDPQTRFFRVELDHPYNGLGIIRDYLKFEED